MGFVNGFLTALGIGVGLLTLVLLSFVPVILLSVWAAVRDAWVDRKRRKAAERLEKKSDNLFEDFVKAMRGVGE